jgi:hypothetical protein
MQAIPGPSSQPGARLEFDQHTAVPSLLAVTAVASRRAFFYDSPPYRALCSLWGAGSTSTPTGHGNTSRPGAPFTFLIMEDVR